MVGQLCNFYCQLLLLSSVLYYLSKSLVWESSEGWMLNCTYDLLVVVLQPGVWFYFVNFYHKRISRCSHLDCTDSTFKLSLHPVLDSTRLSAYSISKRCYTSCRTVRLYDGARISCHWVRRMVYHSLRRTERAMPDVRLPSRAQSTAALGRHGVLYYPNNRLRTKLAKIAMHDILFNHSASVFNITSKLLAIKCERKHKRASTRDGLIDLWRAANCMQHAHEIRLFL